MSDINNTTKRITGKTGKESTDSSTNSSTDSSFLPLTREELAAFQIAQSNELASQMKMVLQEIATNMTNAFTKAMSDVNTSLRDMNQKQNENTLDILTAINKSNESSIAIQNRISSFMEEQNSSYKEIVLGLSNIVEATKLKNAIAITNADPANIFKTSRSGAEQDRWRNSMNSKVYEIIRLSGMDYRSVYNTIYKKSTVNGKNIFELEKEYKKMFPEKKNYSMIAFCSCSDVISDAVEIQINSHLAYYESHQKKPTYKEKQSVPQNIKQMISDASKNGNARGKSFFKFKKLLAENYSGDLDRYYSNVKNRIGNCNFWYAISLNKDIVDTLRGITNSYAFEKMI